VAVRLATSVTVGGTVGRWLRLHRPYYIAPNGASDGPALRRQGPCPSGI